jgi:hypothetical protein
MLYTSYVLAQSKAKQERVCLQLLVTGNWINLGQLIESSVDGCLLIALLYRMDSNSRRSQYNTCNCKYGNFIIVLKEPAIFQLFRGK